MQPILWRAPEHPKVAADSRRFRDPPGTSRRFRDPLQRLHGGSAYNIEAASGDFTAVQPIYVLDRCLYCSSTFTHIKNQSYTSPVTDNFD